MPTRGNFGFFLNDKWYIVYNEFDSYPKGLGNKVLTDLKKSHENGTFKMWKDKVLQLKFIDPTIPPTPEDIAKFAPYTNLKHHTGSTNDWNCLLYKGKNTMVNLLRCGYMMNHIDKETGKPKWEQYAYVINFDTGKVDYYANYGQLMESREITDYLRPFPEVDELKGPIQGGQGGGQAGGQTGGQTGQVGGQTGGQVQGSVAKFCRTALEAFVGLNGRTFLTPSAKSSSPSMKLERYEDVPVSRMSRLNYVRASSQIARASLMQSFMRSPLRKLLR